MRTEKMGIGDSVMAKLGNTTVKPHWGNPQSRKTEKISPRANVHAVLRGPDGAVKYEEWGENLVTDYGDEVIATRLYDDAVEIVTGMRLGTSATAEAKNGAGAFIGTYLTTSNEALDAAATDATKGAGAGWRTTYVCTWVAGDITDGAIAEVALTNENPLTNVQGTAANTPARYVFAATIDKQAGDSLEVTWNIDILGA